MEIVLNVESCYLNGNVSVFIDGKDEEHGGTKVSTIPFKHGDTIISGDILVPGTNELALTGKHSVFFKIEYNYVGWGASYFDDRNIFDLKSFVFVM